MKKLWIPCFVVLVIAAVVLMSRRDESWHDEGSDAQEGRADHTVVKRLESEVPESEPNVVREQAVGMDEAGDDQEDDEEDDRTPAEKALSDRIEKALDEEDLNAAIACVGDAQRCSVVEIRQAMVDTLGWFGEKALPELTPFLVDADADVRRSAMDEWTMALSSIEDDNDKLGVVELAMGALSDEEVLEEISKEFIGVDEKLAVESLSRIISSGGSEAGVAKAKETYEFVTGDEWVSIEDAVRWIAEEYDPPEDQ